MRAVPGAHVWLGQAHSLPRHSTAPVHPRHLLWKTREKEEVVFFRAGFSPILSEGVPGWGEGWGIFALLSPLSRLEGVCGCLSLNALSKHPKILQKIVVRGSGGEGGRGKGKRDFNPLLTPLPSCTNELQDSQGQAALRASRSVEVTQPCPWRLG